MADTARPVLAYEGPESEILFLQTLLDGSGIACSADSPLRGGYGSLATREARLFVAQADMAAAAVLIADFRSHGTKSRT